MALSFDSTSCDLLLDVGCLWRSSRDTRPSVNVNPHVGADRHSDVTTTDGDTGAPDSDRHADV